MNILFAVIFGLVFGFVLQKAGASNPHKIIGMLRVKDLHLMKAIFFGIGLSSILLFLLLNFGIANPSNISVKSSYIGVVIGGVMLGIGWAIAGFCPGTAIVAAGAGRKDALSYIAGGLVGAFIYIQGFGAIEKSFLFEKLGGKSTLAVTGNSNFPGLVSSLPGLAVAGIIGIVFIIIAIKLPEKR